MLPQGPPLPASPARNRSFANNRYMAPELTSGNYTTASEVFSLGVVLLELLTGKRVGSDTARKVSLGCHEGHESIVQAADAGIWPPGAASSLAALIAQCLQNDEEKRPRSAIAVTEQLRAVRAHVSAAALALATCPICMDDVHATAIRTCRAMPPAPVHTCCVSCLQYHVSVVCSDPVMVQAHDGDIPCFSSTRLSPFACCSQPWTAAELYADLGQEARAAHWAAVKATLRAPKEKVAAEEELAKAEADAAKAARPDRVQKLRDLIARADLTLKCPRCPAHFDDFDGCNALRCAKCGCGFCGLCLIDCGADAHHHFDVVHVGVDIFSKSLFERTHRERRIARVSARVRSLAPDSELQRALVNAIAEDLRRIGIDPAAVLQGTGVFLEDADAEVRAQSVGVLRVRFVRCVASAGLANHFPPVAPPHPLLLPPCASPAQAIVDVVGPAAVVSSLVKHSGDAVVVTALCRILANDTQDPVRAQVAVDAGGAAAIVAALRTHSAIRLVAVGLQALRSLAGQESGVRALLAADGIAELVRVMSIHPKSAHVVERATSLLERILRKCGGPETLLDADALAAVVSALCYHTNDEDIAVIGCKLLYRNALVAQEQDQIPVAMGALCAAGGYAFACDALRAHSSNRRIAKYAVVVIRTLTSPTFGTPDDFEGRQRVAIDAGAPVRLAHTLRTMDVRKLRSDEDLLFSIVTLTIEALERVCLRNTAGSVAASAAGAPRDLTLVLRAQSSAPLVAVAAACKALCAIAKECACVPALLTSRTPDALVAALRGRHGEDVALKKSATLALLRIARGSPEGRAAVTEAGGGELIEPPALHSLSLDSSSEGGEDGLPSVDLDDVDM